MTASGTIGRNRAIDVLRGWAIVLMISSHIGYRSRLSAVINLPLWLDAAGPFVLLSGVVLGMGMSGGKSLSAVWRRSRQIWSIHVVAMALVIAVHEATGRLNAPSVADAGGLGAVLWKVPSLRLQALDFMNILPLFVVFFAIAPSLVAAMRRGLTGLVLVASLGLWLLTQSKPEWMHFTDPAGGHEAFLLPAWQLPFVLGLTVGFHASAVATMFRQHRTGLVSAMGIAAFGGFVLAQFQRKLAMKFGAHLPESVEWVFGKEAWGPGRAVYTLSLLGLGYLGIDTMLRKGRAGGMAPLEVLGRKSLYSFLVHLPIALLASALSLQGYPALLQDLALATALVVVYQMARHEVLGRWLPR